MFCASPSSASNSGSKRRSEKLARCLCRSGVVDLFLFFVTLSVATEQQHQQPRRRRGSFPDGRSGLFRSRVHLSREEGGCRRVREGRIYLFFFLSLSRFLTPVFFPFLFQHQKQNDNKNQSRRAVPRPAPSGAGSPRPLGRREEEARAQGARGSPDRFFLFSFEFFFLDFFSFSFFYFFSSLLSAAAALLLRRRKGAAREARLVRVRRRESPRAPSKLAPSLGGALGARAWRGRRRYG